MAGAIWKRFNWLDGVVIPALSTAMRAAWMAPLIHLALNNVLVSPPGTRFPAWLVWGLILGGAITAWALRNQAAARLRAALLGVIIIILTCGFLFGLDASAPQPWARELLAAMLDLERGIHPAWLVIPTVAILWARGTTVEFDDFDAQWRSFRIGAVTLICAVLVARSSIITSREGLDLVAAMSAFLLWGFLSLALASVSRALWLERLRNGRAPALSRHWLLVVSAVLAVVVLGGMVLGQLLAPEAAERLRLALGAILGLVGRALAFLATGLFYVIFWLIGPLLERIRGQLVPFEPRAEQQMPNFQEQFEEITTAQPEAEALAHSYGITLLILLAIGVVIVLLIFWRRRRRSRPAPVDETRELIWSRELMLEQLRGLFRRRPKRRPSSLYFDLGDLGTPRYRIRSAYQRLLAAARQHDWPRLPGQTPSAYRAELEAKLPAAAEPLAALTASYLVARYAGEEPSEALAAEAEAALEGIRQALSASK